MSLGQHPNRRVSTSKPRNATQELLTIGDLAKEFSVTLRTLRFYEDRGLLAPHRDGNTRFYTERDRSRLKQILQAKRLGFTLVEIRDLMAANKTADGHGVLPLKPDQIASQIDHLKRQRDEINEAIGQLIAALKR